MTLIGLFDCRLVARTLAAEVCKERARVPDQSLVATSCLRVSSRCQGGRRILVLSRSARWSYARRNDERSRGRLQAACSPQRVEGGTRAQGPRRFETQRGQRVRRSGRMGAGSLARRMEVVEQQRAETKDQKRDKKSTLEKGLDLSVAHAVWRWQWLLIREAGGRPRDAACFNPQRQGFNRFATPWGQTLC
ncbi:hypothetical protein BC567DRAFT_87753 [Phyllosticta citribraziliensis]